MASPAGRLQRRFRPRGGPSVQSPTRFTSPSSMSSPPFPASPGSSSQGKQGSEESIGLYAVQCSKCFAWRTVPTKDEYETIREKYTTDPWICSKRPGSSCEDPADIQYDTSLIWIMDKPNIPKPPPKTERLVIMRKDLTKTDIYYILPNGKRAKGKGDVLNFLDTNPNYIDSLPLEKFSFKLPKIDAETVPGSPKKQNKTNASSSKN